MTRVYLGGPMRGLPDDNEPAFIAAAADLRGRGLTLVTPFDLDDGHDDGLRGAIRRDIEAIFVADAVVMLPCRHYSPGVQMEMSLADMLRIPVYTYPLLGDLLSLAPGYGGWDE